MELVKGSKVKVITDGEEAGHFLVEGSVATVTGKSIMGLYGVVGPTVDGGECEQYLEASDFELL